MGTVDFMIKKFYMSDLKNRLTHILEHERQLAGANEATIQQYVVLPILRALGWDDTNLASMEVLPEYQVESGRVDYALKAGRKPALFIECKKWNEPIERHEDQIITYASYSNASIAVLTNGKNWRFYLLKKEERLVSNRIFYDCNIKNKNLGAIAFSLGKYLLRDNISSGHTTEEAEKVWQDKQEVENLVPRDIWNHYWTSYRSEKVREFHRHIAETRVLAKKEGWELNPKFTKRYCGLWVRRETNQREILVYGIHLDYSPFRCFVKITEEEAEKLRNHYGCEIVYYHTHARQAHYIAPGDVEELLPALEFAYNKHRGD